MAIRKEQVVALIALAIGGWFYSDMGEEESTGRSDKFAPKARDYAAVPVVPMELAGQGKGEIVRKPIFTPPSETLPLPPRDLAFPPHAPLSIAALPLDPGPDFGHMLMLRDDGATVEGFQLQTVAGAPAAAETEDPASGPPANRAQQAAIAAKTYDQVFAVGLTQPYFGWVEVDGMDKYDAEKLTDFEGKVVRFRPYSLTTQKTEPVIKLNVEGTQKVARIVLADNLRNAVEREKRKFTHDAGHLGELGRLIEWLIERARDANWVYDEAIAHADEYVRLDQGGLEGVRWQQRVLRAKGDLAGEFKLLEGITGPHRESAFRYEGLGTVKAQLGLLAEAEQDLRKATTLAPTDARPHGALAEYLRQRGRMREAAAAAKRAEETFGSLLDASDKARIARTIASVHLGLGDLDKARAARKLAPADAPLHYLDGCIAYAAGDLATALGEFRQVVTADDRGAALLAQGACLLRQKQWQEAYEAFVAVADREPLLRSRAWCGLALLHLKIGVLDGAIGFCDRALEADPQEAYALYLRGLTQRKLGQLGPAGDALAGALRLHDDFVHAILEVAEVNAVRAAGAHGEEAAQAAVAAVRYGDRAATLAQQMHQQTVEIYEKQALLQFAALDADGAEEAFKAARDTAASEADKLFAKGSLAVVEYSRGHVEEAQSQLRRLIEDLAKDHPMRIWAEATDAAIDDHAQKEMLEDRFERSEPGKIWGGENDGPLHAEIHDNMLVFNGTWARGEVTAERVGAVQRGKNFLAVAATLRLGKGHSREADCFTGLRIQTQRGAGGNADSQIEVGLRGSKPCVRIIDNREDPKWIELPIPGLDPAAPHELELRVLSKGEDQGRQFVLQVRWNGVAVHQQDIKSLSGATATELKTILFANGKKGGKVDVAFDDYRLERRKETNKP